MNKRRFYTELAYVIGLISLAFGTAFMERTGFGVSMVVAPAYVLHLKISQFLSFFSFGMATYTLQAVILILMMILLRRIKLSYFFSFVTAVIYGLVLDASMSVVSLIPSGGFMLDVAFYALGILLCCTGVSLFFHTYIPPEAYDLFVKEVSQKFHLNINKFKTVYDCSSLVLSILLSLLFLGHLHGIGPGTIVTALVNGTIIGLLSKLFEKIWSFEDLLPLQKYL